MITRHFLSSEYAPSAPEAAGFHVIPAPLERSVSYGGGTANGPAALLAASQQLEAWENGWAPGESGFYTAPPIDCAGPLEAVLDRIEEAVRYAVACKAIPVVLGGEHIVSLGALRALGKSSAPFGILQIDAHADLRKSYEGNPFSHACVMFRAVHDLGLPLAQFAVRELSQEEAELRGKYAVLHYDADMLAQEGIPRNPLPPTFPRRLYVSFDLDGLDASLMPATGTPSPGGLFWHDAIRLLTNCAEDREILGMDIVELAPIQGLHHADYTAAKLTHALMSLALATKHR
ncbi:MAG: agmatinase [Desulfovibrio sp.]|jgi:agmatinase|nr:agmatinase [Desulfovibrio sp.]